ncbi:glycosyl transferase [Bacillus cereus]|uniref:glycosyltransferase n=1 Tax=Bacillus cereus TaxID=1396 RepID=UPI000BF06F44|nr:glycosyltransferase [Bacillus cereus]PEL95296.1 glycosyl transferase [Bacillus cereus]
MNKFIQNLLKKLKCDSFFTNKVLEDTMQEKNIDSKPSEISTSIIPFLTENTPLLEQQEDDGWDTQVSPTKDEMDIINLEGFHFCTIVGKHYLFKVLALYESLQKHTKNFTLFICCMDELTLATLQNKQLEHVILIPVRNLENNLLKKIKSERKINEYCWTLKAPFMEFLFRTYNIPRVLYCDSDLFFFSDPKPIFDEWREFAAFLCPQRDSQFVEERFGKFQAGLIGFKNNFHGRKSLKWWKEQCLNWCYQESDGENFGDQKYLDKIPLYFHHIKISNHLGIDAAPWNCIYNNNFNFKTYQNDIYIEDDKLIVFHFACLSIFNQSQFDLWSLSPLMINKFIKNNIYIPYLDALRRSMDEIRQINIDIFNECRHQENISTAKNFYNYTPLRRKMDQHDFFFNFTTIVSQKYVIKFLAYYSSLATNMKNFHIWVLCMDPNTYNTLQKMELPNIILINVEKIENTLLKSIQNTRSLQEYCWTLKPYLCSYILSNYTEIDHIIYCDADMFFFSDPTALLTEWSTYSIFLCRQRGSNNLENKFGIYQAGLIGFKREQNSLDILNWWEIKCLDRCSNTYDEYYDSWGDQKYLETIPLLFSNIKILENIGINVAPWNSVMSNNHLISQNNNKVYIDNQPLISYHFGSLLMINKQDYDTWYHETLNFTPSILQFIYIPYIKSMKQATKKLQKTLGQKDVSEFYASVPLNYVPKNPFQI